MKPFWERNNRSDHTWGSPPPKIQKPLRMSAHSARHMTGFSLLQVICQLYCKSIIIEMNPLVDHFNRCIQCELIQGTSRRCRANMPFDYTDGAPADARNQF